MAKETTTDGDSNDFLIGMSVFHKTFERGEIEQVDHKGYIYVQFDSQPRVRKFLLGVLTDVPGKYFSDCSDEIARRKDAKSRSNYRPDLPYDASNLPSFAEEEQRILLNALGIAVTLAANEPDKAVVRKGLTLPARDTEVRLKDVVKRKGIQSLLHYTHAKNLFSILDIGLKPRATIIESGINALLPPDDLKTGDSRAVTLSISFAEQESFQAIQRAVQKGLWAILELDISILWEKKCYFVAKEDDFYLRTQRPSLVEDFQNLFQDETIYHAKWAITISRSNLEIPTFYSTNPQAQIRVIQDIEPRFIRTILFQTPATERVFLKAANDRGIAILPKTSVNPSAFEERVDSFFWKEFRSIMIGEKVV